MAFIKASATFTNGSATVSTVSYTEGGPSFIASGTSVVVGTDPVVAQVEAITASTDTLTLRDVWPLATGTYSFIAFDTIEGLRDAVQSAREFSQRLQDADALIAALSRIFTDTSTGLANTSPGEFFSVVGAGDVFITLYENVAGTAVVKEQVSSKSYIDGIVAQANSAKDAAATSESNAATSEANAATSEINAATSAAAALASEGNAATSEANAATSESNAAASEGNAATSEANAATSASEAETAKTAAETARTGAEAAESIAQAAANYVGAWSTLTGALNIPASTLHSDNIWMLVQNIADVTTIEPGTNIAYWVSVGSTTGTAPNALQLGGVPAAEHFSEQHLPQIAEVSGLTAALADKASASTITLTETGTISRVEKLTRVLINSIGDVVATLNASGWSDGDRVIIYKTFTLGSLDVASAQSITDPENLTDNTHTVPAGFAATINLLRLSGAWVLGVSING